MCCSRLLKMPAPIAVLCVHKELHCCLIILLSQCCCMYFLLKLKTRQNKVHGVHKIYLQFKFIFGSIYFLHF